MADRLNVAVQDGPEHLMMTVAGDCDALTHDQFRVALEQAVTPDSQLVIVDLSGLTFLDSSGVHVLVDAGLSVAAAGGRLVLACPRRIVARVLSLTGADQLIRVADTVEQAMAYQ